MDAIDSRNPTNLEKKINDSKKNVETNHVVRDHYLIKNTRATVSNKLTAREIYSVLQQLSGNTPTSQKYFGKIFLNENLDWKKIYTA